MTVIWVVLAVLIGIGATMQPALNNRLAQDLGLSTAVLTSAILVLICSVAYYILAAEPGRAGLSGLGKVPWYMATGGLFGFGIVLFSVLCFPRLGATLTFALAMAAQFALAAAVDHWGLFGMPEHAMNWPRLAGLGLLAAGAVLVKIY